MQILKGKNEQVLSLKADLHVSVIQVKNEKMKTGTANLLASAGLVSRLQMWPGVEKCVFRVCRCICFTFQ